jgi:rubredoxin
MECRACGHKHNVWDGDKCESTFIDTKPFDKIKSAFTTAQGEWAWEGPDEVHLYICPECGTVRAEKR